MSSKIGFIKYIRLFNVMKRLNVFLRLSTVSLKSMHLIGSMKSTGLHSRIIRYADKPFHPCNERRMSCRH